MTARTQPHPELPDLHWEAYQFAKGEEERLWEEHKAAFRESQRLYAAWEAAVKAEGGTP